VMAGGSSPLRFQGLSESAPRGRRSI